MDRVHNICSRNRIRFLMTIKSNKTWYKMMRMKWHRRTRSYRFRIRGSPLRRIIRSRVNARNRTQWQDITNRRMRSWIGWLSTQARSGLTSNSVADMDNSTRSKAWDPNGHLSSRICNGSDLNKSSKILSLWSLKKTKIVGILMWISSMVLLPGVGSFLHFL